ncbi:tRNA 2-selenouridine synthase [Desulfuromusa kysingii]|uniref:tRNA 2-selenouridine synthase n=1 Tax=Desulfuromusa kysingii TaxID=37625 RepID=A0A1H3XRR8_9BACT|nr:tRNA 2-selenouridine(34) synthase MnmH [Desulfuromusa kysingii]SEA01208.1 tRNA 2-selenouridine synthase [Desulfuromusa kysingii]
MQETIELEKALQQRRKGALLIDVRTPAEFAESTIPGAVNVPIFSNEERAQVGTLYKLQGKRDARTRGVEIVAPKIPALLRQVEAARRGHSGPVIVFCWRGGMRSLAMTSFMNLAGIPARQLLGGHKGFRRTVLDFFEQQQWPPVFVLRGLTGVGKTRILTQLQQRDYPVIDLEGLANHRGSAFGALGLEPQPLQKQFDALLWDRLDQLRDRSYLVTEGESLHIGRLMVPKTFHQAMQIQTSLWITATLDVRTQIILEDYPALDQLREQFQRPIMALKERLGRNVVNEFLKLLNSGEWDKLVRELMVRYYDPLYMHTLPEQRIEVELETVASATAKVAAVLDKITADKDGLL